MTSYDIQKNIDGRTSVLKSSLEFLSDKVIGTSPLINHPTLVAELCDIFQSASVEGLLLLKNSDFRFLIANLKHNSPEENLAAAKKIVTDQEFSVALKTLLPAISLTELLLRHSNSTQQDPLVAFASLDVTQAKEWAQNFEADASSKNGTSKIKEILERGANAPSSNATQR